MVEDGNLEVLKLLSSTSSKIAQGEVLQLGAGIEIHAKPGDIVKEGQSILTLHSDESARFDRAKEALVGAFSIGDQNDPVKRLPLVIERIEG